MPYESHSGIGLPEQHAAAQAWLSYTSRLQSAAQAYAITQVQSPCLPLPQPEELSILVASGFTLKVAAHAEEHLVAALRQNHLPRFLARLQTQFGGYTHESDETNATNGNEARACCKQLCSGLQDLWVVVQQHLSHMEQLTAMLLHQEQLLHPHASVLHAPHAHVMTSHPTTTTTGRPPIQPHHQGGHPAQRDSTPTSFTFPTILSTAIHPSITTPPPPGAGSGPVRTNQSLQQTERSTLSLMGVVSSYRDRLTAMLLLPRSTCNLPGVLRCVLTAQLNCIMSLLPTDEEDHQHTSSDMDEGDAYGVCSSPSSSSNGLLSALRQLSSLLCHLGASQLCHQTVTQCLSTCVRNHCSAMTQGMDRRVLPAVWQFLDAGPLKFIQSVLEGEEDANAGMQEGSGVTAMGQTRDQRVAEALKVWRQRLVYMCYEAVGEMRCDQMFSIVVDYPDSMMAVEDMAECLANTNLRSHFLTAFRSALSRRLLHPGASATDIVHTYVSTIRVVTALDADGTLLPAVALPVRRYLRLRPDTVRCVVERVTGAPGLTGKAVVGAVGVVEDGDLEGGPAVSLLEEVQEDQGFPSSATSVDDEDHVISLIESQRSHMCGVTTATASGASNAIPQLSMDNAFTSGHGTHQHVSDHGCVWPGEVPFIHGTSNGQYSTNNTAAAATRGGNNSGGGGGADVVDLMVQVFKNKEHFVTEYRSCLSVQLIRSMEHDSTQALRTIELLKLRFGEQTLHACEVMLKDMADSRRINTACHHMVVVTPPPHTPGTLTPSKSPPAPTTPLPTWMSATIISHLFWPQLGGWGDEQQKAGTSKAQRSGPDLDAEASVVLPRQVSAGLQAYEQRFHQLKAPRRLHWKPHLGLVELEITVGEVSLNAKVSPVLASLLMPFAESSALTARELATIVGLPALLVRRRLMFWLEAGIIIEDTTQTGSGGTPRYIRATTLEPWLHGVTLTDATALDETSMNNGTTGNSGVEEMAAFEPYIMGILLNTGGLPLDRLHTTLKRFVVSPKYEASQELLAAFLSSLVAADKLTVTAGVYKRKMAPARPAEN